MERGRLFQRRRICRFCHEKVPIDYKDVGLLRNFLTERGYPAQRVTTEGRGKRDIEKLRIWDGDQFTVEQIHQMLRRVELVWKQ